MTGLKRVQHRHQVPVVLTREEDKAVLGLMEGTTRLMAELIYGAGLRVHELHCWGAETVPVRRHYQAF